MGKITLIVFLGGITFIEPWIVSDRTLMLNREEHERF